VQQNGSIRCSRSWGELQSLVIATLRGSPLLHRGDLRFSGVGVTIDVISRRAVEADVAIEVGGDAALGYRSLLISFEDSVVEFPHVFTVVAPVWSSFAGPGAIGIGSHLL
jgi:hypothetical protein